MFRKKKLSDEGKSMNYIMYVKGLISNKGVSCAKNQSNQPKVLV